MLEQRTFKGVFDKSLEVLAKFRGHFQTQGVDFLGKHLKFILSSNFENFEKY